MVDTGFTFEHLISMKKPKHSTNVEVINECMIYCTVLLIRKTKRTMTTAVLPPQPLSFEILPLIYLSTIFSTTSRDSPSRQGYKLGLKRGSWYIHYVVVKRKQCSTPIPTATSVFLTYPMIQLVLSTSSSLGVDR